MPPNTEMATTSPANPQMPMLGFNPDSVLVDGSIGIKSTTTTTTTSKTTAPSIENIHSSSKDGYVSMPSWKQVSPETHFNIGILIDNTNIKDRHVVAISKPASSCTLSSLVILHPSRMGSTGNETAQDGTNLDETEATLVASAREWLRTNKAENVVDDIAFGQGQKGWEEMIQSPDIDAVYIVVPPCSQNEYVLQALRARKHVLLNDPISTSLTEFEEQIVCAKKYGKFIQSSTMFVHQYRVQRFMNRVLQDDGFGRITEVDASIQLNCGDVEKVGVKLPLRQQDGAIRVLGRFCVLVSTLFFNRLGSFAESARVNSVTVGERDEIMSADCTVTYTQNRKLNFYVAYVQTATRQAIELKATSRYASMNDFVIEHPDGLATYRVYDKMAAPDGKIHVSSGDSIDVAMGMGQERVLWRNFARLGHALDERGGWDDSEAIAECIELTNVSLQTKKILIALMKSADNPGTDIPIPGV